jgi:hypothetical protein
MGEVVKYSYSQNCLEGSNFKKENDEKQSNLRNSKIGFLNKLTPEEEVIQSTKTLKGNNRILNKLMENVEKQKSSAKSNLTLPSLKFKCVEELSNQRIGKEEKEVSEKILIQRKSSEHIVQPNPELRNLNNNLNFQQQTNIQTESKTPCNKQVQMHTSGNFVNNSVVYKNEKKNAKKVGCFFFKCFG